MEGKRIPRIAVKIQDDNFTENCLKVIQVVRPEWFNYNSEDRILAKVFTEGITNKIIGFNLATDPRNTVLLIIKIYGESTELMIDREEEIKTMMLLHKAKCGPELYAAFENGITYEFIHGMTLTMEMCSSPSIYPMVAAEMARLHTAVRLIPEAGQTKVRTGVWKKIEKYVELNKCVLENNQEVKDRLYVECGFSLEKVKNEIKELTAILERENMPVAFCHNDILRGNVVYNKSEQQVSFIDFEYAMPNYAPFDVAAHFLGFVGIDNPDFSLCPGPEFTSKWISEYLKVFGTSEFKREEFAKWVNLCYPLVHLFWLLWAVVQAHHSSIDFDFVRLVCLRYKEFSKRMEGLRSGRIL